MSIVKRNFNTGAYLLIGDHKKTSEEIGKILKRLKVKPVNNPDLLVIDQETIGIDQIREVKKFFSLKNWQEKKRVVVIHHGEGLSIPAQNAFLKTLEETKPGQLIFIGAPQKEILLPTIISRCQSFWAGSKKSSASNHLKKILHPSLAERFLFIQKEIKKPKMSKTEASSWLKTLIHQAHDQLIKSKNPHQLYQLKKTINLLQKSQSFIQANVSPQTAIDWLLINL